ncbi:MAG: RluA family pseudouridine synthase [Candidatus Binatia bacterium]
MPSQWIAHPTDGNQRLDTFLANRYPMVARRELIEWIHAGKVTVNGQRGKKGEQIKTGDIIVVRVLPILQPNPNLPVRVLFADHALVVLDKPSGIASVAIRSEDTHTAVNFLCAHFPQATHVSPRPLEAGIVHRLDTATSGLLVAARTAAAYTTLRQQFAHRLVEKRYLALVKGHLRVAGEQGSFLAPVGRHRQRMQEVGPAQGQYAQTFYVPLRQLPQHTLVQIVIPTGVRHQIRVHLATLGHPIIGDTLYGDTRDQKRLCLHAEALSFVHPTTKERVHFNCPLPEDFRAIQEQFT